MLKTFLRRVRRFLGAEVMDEMKALRAELAQRDAGMEAALLTIALREPGLRAGTQQGSAAPLAPEP